MINAGRSDSLNFIWDTNLLTWVVQTAAAAGGGGTVDQGSGGLSAWLVKLSQTGSDNVVVSDPPGDLTASGSITAAAQTVSLEIEGRQSAALTLAGTFVGTLLGEASRDGGATWYIVRLLGSDGGSSVISLNGGDSEYAYVFGGLGGATDVRIRASAFTSGTADIVLSATQAGYVVSQVQLLESGANIGWVNLNNIGVAATAAKQDTGNTSLASIDSKLTDPLPVSAATLPLPSGAATSAKQDTGNTSLASIDGKLTNPLPVSAATLPLPSGAATAAKQDTGNTSVANIDTKTPALGQALAAASTPVVLTAAQITTLTPVSTVTANAGTNLNTSLLALEAGGNLAAIAGKDFATQTTLALVKAKTDNLDVALSTLVTATLAGSLTEAAPATDTASSGLNGRLQRIAQRISSLITAMGSPFQAGGSIGNTTFAATQATGTNLHTVVDSGTITTVGTVTNITNTVPTKEVRCATPTQTTVADSASTGTILASNANRLGATIANDSSAALYLKLGATASLTSYTARLTQYGYYEVPFGYTGIIDGIWATDPGDGAARVTELTT